jgi:hypothetical protein
MKKPKRYNGTIRWDGGDPYHVTAIRQLCQRGRG